MLSRCLPKDRILKQALYALLAFVVCLAFAGGFGAWDEYKNGWPEEGRKTVAEAVWQYGPASPEAAAAVKQVGESANPKEIVALVDPATGKAIAAWPTGLVGKRPEEMTLSTGAKLPALDRMRYRDRFTVGRQQGQNAGVSVRVTPIYPWSAGEMGDEGHSGRYGRGDGRDDGRGMGPGPVPEGMAPRREFGQGWREFGQGWRGFGEGRHGWGGRRGYSRLGAIRQQSAVPQPMGIQPPAVPQVPAVPQPAGAQRAPALQPEAILLVAAPAEGVTVLRVLAGLAGALAAVGFVIYWLSIAWWVFADARRRGGKAFAWGVLALLTNLVGAAVYLVARQEQRNCSSCGAAVERSFNNCPHCGQTLKHRCGQCGHQLRNGWTHCPNCGAKYPPESESD